MTTEWPPLPPIRTGICGLCPRCGQGHLFDGFLTLKPKCEVCDLNYSFADPADGPAFFVICFMCIPAVAIAVWTEVSYSPHGCTLLACLPLRPLRDWLVNSQFYYKAERARLT